VPMAPPDAAAATRRVTATAWGFIAGSALFAVGVPLSLDTALSPAVAGWVYFAGSVLFTSAGLLQFLSSRDDTEPAGDTPASWWHWAARPRTADWTASAIQLVGTLAFNVTTLRAALDAAGTHHTSAEVVWRPDAVGSVLFLVSSAIAFAPEVRWRRHRHARDRSWAIGAVNLLGSVLFGVSAVGAQTTSAGSLVSLWWANVGTFLGAACFLVGAWLLLPRHAAAAPAT